MKFVIVYPKANAIFVEGERLEFEFTIPNNLPQNLTMLHWNDPNLDGAIYRTETDEENLYLEETEENYNLWVKPFVEMWEAECSRSFSTLVKQQLSDTVQRVLDSKAQELFYDSCLSVCSYIDSGVQKFDEEGRAFRSWRSAVWLKGYEILAEVQAGERKMPTDEELLAMLPKLEISYS